MTDIHTRVKAVVASASNGAITQEALRAAGGRLAEAGFDSMSALAVIMGLENEFGIVVAMDEDASFLSSIDTIATYVAVQLQSEVAR